MAKLYTRSGDDGFCETANAERVRKSDSLICLIGTLDEAQAVLGIASAELEENGLCADIKMVEQLLSELMGELSGGAVLKTDVRYIEKLTDKYAREFHGFTLPGANKSSAYLNFARCVIRRAEREASGLLFEERIQKETYACINRMSDLLYAMSIYAEEI